MLEFYKYHGTGNDFVMIDNRTEFFQKDNKELVAFLCHRRFGIGGDGLILLENAEGYDFKMVYYNADGSESTMCGNGGRCLVAFAKQLNIIEDKCRFIAIDGEHLATVATDGTVSLKMIDVSGIKIEDKHSFLNTGSPHHVQVVRNIGSYDVFNIGKDIRESELYAPGGTNVNFVEQEGPNHFRIRTFERGVEDETLSCGTGATAVAISMYAQNKCDSNSIQIDVEGGSLNVSFETEDNISFKNVWLSGPAKLVFGGEIEI
ncbi:diaminopimelate epimerase [Myroides marinus]|uniref:diaminopimelate epimerase n=1 Tax=Myroides marinus TaxID=703342 RepID=UPI0007419CFE|nr:diaminopimelate epimerase [Myroides marinus]KUF40331.1 diaminopimelate epimerase [Myroides marinus]MDM1347593.1 diaminopimelate epimerase [Myroides marinus]MDM1354380.1 diaminopimelate epimerase [Myroides marinus]MDM1360793.1 diaminopimelate epimerase [Myroides marinus]MDM1379880.1 diaminopimelate epimerase [Myroides marinus]